MHSHHVPGQKPLQICIQPQCAPYALQSKRLVHLLQPQPPSVALAAAWPSIGRLLLPSIGVAVPWTRRKGAPRLDLDINLGGSVRLFLFLLLLLLRVHSLLPCPAMECQLPKHVWRCTVSGLHHSKIQTRQQMAACETQLQHALRDGSVCKCGRGSNRPDRLP